MSIPLSGQRLRAAPWADSAEMLRRLRRRPEARAALRRALSHASQPAERRPFERKLQDAADDGDGPRASTPGQGPSASRLKRRR